MRSLLIAICAAAAFAIWANGARADEWARNAGLTGNQAEPEGGGEIASRYMLL